MVQSHLLTWSVPPRPFIDGSTLLMYWVSRLVHGVGNQAQPLGIVVGVASISQASHSIPAYGPMIQPSLDAANCLGVCQNFWRYCFLDKETYQVVY